MACFSVPMIYNELFYKKKKKKITSYTPNFKSSTSSYDCFYRKTVPTKGVLNANY